MKNATRQELESGRPDISAAEAVGFCLQRLYQDRQHILTEEFVRGLSFEELIGALLLARDAIKDRGRDYEE